MPLRLPNVSIVQGPKMALPWIVHLRTYTNKALPLMAGTEHPGWITRKPEVIQGAFSVSCLPTIRKVDSGT